LYGAVKYPKTKTKAPDKACKMKTIGLTSVYKMLKPNVRLTGTIFQTSVSSMTA